MKPRPSFWFAAFAITAASVWIYWPSFRGGWVWDDHAEVTQNALLRDPRGWFKVWFAPSTTDYFPLKTEIQWIGWRLWRLHPLGWHGLSFALHLFSVFSFWRLLQKLGVRLAWIGGLLLAIHPLAVESVAWIAELKNTLSLTLLLLAANAYVEFDVRSAAGSASAARRPYAAALGWFTAALLAKSTVVMFPCGILLYSRWRHGRLTRTVLRASAPFFALSLGLGLVTVWFQLHRAIGAEPLGIGGLVGRSAGAGWATVFYLGKSLFPVGLAALYPQWPDIAQVRWLDFWPWPVWGGVFIALGLRREPWARAVGFGLGWWLLNLIPVSGLIPMAYLRLSWVADHFAYIALLGILGLVAAGLSRLMDVLANRKPAALAVAARALGAAAALALAGLSRARAELYRSDEIFWRGAERDNPHSWLPPSNLGLILTDEGRPREAVAEFERGLQADSHQPELRNNYGQALAAMGNPRAALNQFAAAVRLKPNWAEARINFASALAQAGMPKDALAQYAQVLELQPDNAQVHGYRGALLAQLGSDAQAREELATAIRLNGAWAEPHYRLGSVEANAGELPAAIAEFRAALRIDPQYVDAWSNLGLALTLSHDAAAAIAPLQRALALRPTDAAARAYLGFALAESGRNADAVAAYRAALELSPNNSDVHYNLGRALQALGRTGEAQAEFQAAQRLQPGAGTAR